MVLSAERRKGGAGGQGGELNGWESSSVLIFAQELGDSIGWVD